MQDINFIMLLIASDHRLSLLPILYFLLTSDLNQAILYDQGVKQNKLKYWSVCVFLRKLEVPFEVNAVAKPARHLVMQMQIFRCLYTVSGINF